MHDQSIDAGHCYTLQRLAREEERTWNVERGTWKVENEDGIRLKRRGRRRTNEPRDQKREKRAWYHGCFILASRRLQRSWSALSARMDTERPLCIEASHLRARTYLFFCHPSFSSASSSPPLARLTIDSREVYGESARKSETESKPDADHKVVREQGKGKRRRKRRRRRRRRRRRKRRSRRSLKSRRRRRNCYAGRGGAA